MFWGLIMEPGKKYSQTVEKAFHISHAALDLDSAQNQSVQVLLGFQNRNYLLCTLNKDKWVQVPLDLNFQTGDKVSFATNGPGHVHLTGYLITEEEDLSLYEEGEEEEEEDEKIPELVPVNNKKRKAETKLEKQNKKTKSETQKLLDEVNDDSDDSNDSDVNLTDLLEEEQDEEVDEEDDDDDEEEDDEDEDDEDDEDSDDEEEEESEEEIKQTSPSQKQKKAKKEKPKQNGIVKNQEKQKGEKAKQEKSVKPDQKGDKSPKQGKATKRVLQGGVIVEDIKVGEGAVAASGRQVQVYYEGRLQSNNKMFDSTKKGNGFKFRLGKGEVIKGWDIGVAGMKIGGKRKITCPPNMAYGAQGSPPVIPPQSTLVFEVELKNVK